MRPKVAREILAEIYVADSRRQTGPEMIDYRTKDQSAFKSFDLKPLSVHDGRSVGETDELEKRKAAIILRIEEMHPPFKRKYRHMILEASMAVASVALTAFLSLGANQYSDTIGTATTFVAGISGSGGIFLATKDSILSLSSTKKDFLNQLDDLRSKTKSCDDLKELAKIEGRVDSLFSSLYDKAEIKQ